MRSHGLEAVTSRDHITSRGERGREDERRIDLATALGVRYVNQGDREWGRPVPEGPFLPQRGRSGRYAEKAGVLVCLETAWRAYGKRAEMPRHACQDPEPGHPDQL